MGEGSPSKGNLPSKVILSRLLTFPKRPKKGKKSSPLLEGLFHFAYSNPKVPFQRGDKKRSWQMNPSKPFVSPKKPEKPTAIVRLGLYLPPNPKLWIVDGDDDIVIPCENKPISDLDEIFFMRHIYPILRPEKLLMKPRDPSSIVAFGTIAKPVVGIRKTIKDWL